MPHQRNGQDGFKGPQWRGEGASSSVRQMTAVRTIANFGRNLRFRPRHYYAPRTEDEVLEILDRHADGKIRVVASLHSWSCAAVCEDVIIDLRHFQGVQVSREDETGDCRATVGGGTTIKRLLRELRRHHVTMPTLGAITEQTIAGAVSTGTHGSGRHSLSHYIEQVRVAAYDPQTGRATIYTWSDGPELLAARCAVGCMGIVLSLRFRCIPRYYVVEVPRPCSSLSDVLAGEADWPLQQFVLLPWSWKFFAIQRRVATEPAEQRRNGLAPLYRLYSLLYIDVGFHLLVKLLVRLHWARLQRFAFRCLFPRMFFFMGRTIVDHSEEALILEHELFRHLEMELFVPARHVGAAVDFVRQVLTVFAGQADDVEQQWSARLKQLGLHEKLRAGHGEFTFHYPLFFRRVLSEDTLISMASARASEASARMGETSAPRGVTAAEPYYTISFFNYARPYRNFFPFAEFLAESMTRLFAARPHWGKHFPLKHSDVEARYPALPEFRELCRQVDPRGVFRNEYVNEVLGFNSSHT
jgi:FAD/FMN-containing dehydrogenase